MLTHCSGIALASHLAAAAALAFADRVLVSPASWSYSRRSRGCFHLPSSATHARRTSPRIAAQRSGDRRAQRASTASSSGIVAGGLSCHALQMSKMYAPTASVDMSSTLPLDAKSVTKNLMYGNCSAIESGVLAPTRKPSVRAERVTANHYLSLTMYLFPLTTRVPNARFSSHKLMCEQTPPA